MDQRRLGQAQLPRVVAALPEVRVLVDGAGDEAGDLGRLLAVLAEDEREGGREGGGRLRGREGELEDVVARERDVSGGVGVEWWG